MQSSTKRPWLAAALGVLATGLGHLYLRRWARALWWITLSFSVTVLFVPDATLDAVVAGTAGRGDLLGLAPVLAVVAASTVDAYLLAHAHNARRITVATDGTLTKCPNCRKELDADIEFCHWCTAEFSDFRVVPPDNEQPTEDD